MSAMVNVIVATQVFLGGELISPTAVDMFDGEELNYNAHYTIPVMGIGKLPLKEFIEDRRDRPGRPSIDERTLLHEPEWVLGDQPPWKKLRL
jgi:hypothetical protein